MRKSLYYRSSSDSISPDYAYTTLFYTTLFYTTLCYAMPQTTLYYRSSSDSISLGYAYTRLRHRKLTEYDGQQWGDVCHGLVSLCSCLGSCQHVADDLTE